MAAKVAGTGNPGYKFDDELHPDVKHITRDIVCGKMPDQERNGSQFTTTETPC
jgi:cyclophilin family peptidyl-prolyl cis-trans isomerase